MRKEGSLTFGPMEFNRYLRECHLGAVRTWASISIDSIDRLPSELRNSRCMVFRLGAAENGDGTQFALARCIDGWSDYFLIDDDIFSACAIEPYRSSRSPQDLLAFELLPQLTESSYVNLAIASGLMGYALGIDEGQALIPATSQSAATFEVRAHREIPGGWLLWCPLGFRTGQAANFSRYSFGVR